MEESSDGWAAPGVRVPVAVRDALRVRDAARALVDAPTLTLTAGEKAAALTAVEAARRALDAAHLALVRALTPTDVTDLGAVSAAGWLSAAFQQAPGRARATVEAAHATCPATGTLPAMAAALAAGQVTTAHLDVAVRTITRIPTRLTRQAATAIDDFFCDTSRRYPPRTCQHLATELLDRLDPDRADRGYDPDAHTRRHLSLTTDPTGMILIRGQLDPLTGAQLKAAIEHYAKPTPATDSGQGTLRLRDPRTPGQRRADALGVLARTALTNPGTRGGAPPHILIHATTDQLRALHTPDPTSAGRAHCQQTGPITPGVLARATCDATLQTILTTPTGAILSLGRTTRLATPAQRRALAARDQGCIIPGCTRPPEQCDAHHITPWTAGGPTNLDNLTLLCGPHHNAVEAGTWQIRIHHGTPHIRGTTPYTTPTTWTTNTYHHDTTHARHLGNTLHETLPLTWPPPAPEAPTDEVPP